MENKTKFAIGCLVQWYEVEMVSEYLDSYFETLLIITMVKLK
jgi:hypothetical protein